MAKKAEEILPMEIIELIQQYVDGENIYIPRKRTAGRNGVPVQHLSRNCQSEPEDISGLSGRNVEQ